MDKSKMLILELQKQGIKAWIRVGFFKWSSLNLPKTVTSVPHEDDCSHAFVELENEMGQRIFVDPTWNRELEMAGFKIAQWDGMHPTDLAINCDKILTKEESAEYLQKIDSDDDMKKNGEFYKAINNYCDSFLKR